MDEDELPGCFSNHHQNEDLEHDEDSINDCDEKRGKKRVFYIDFFFYIDSF
jgi:hypothetical protein